MVPVMNLPVPSSPRPAAYVAAGVALIAAAGVGAAWYAARKKDDGRDA